MSQLGLARRFHLLIGEGVDIAVLVFHLAPAFHNYRLQLVGIGVHGQHTGIGRGEMADEPAVAHTGETDKHISGFAGNDEVAGRRGYAAIDER